MGGQLPKPVTFKIIETYANSHFSCACACINGFREAMEDAHVCRFAGDFALFGVFDGHINAACAQFIGKHLPDAIMEMEKTKHALTTEDLIDLALKSDLAFLNQGVESGSTGTYFVVTVKDKKYHLQVCNVGDSRVLVSDKGVATPMTEDHKPMVEQERARIESCDGFVCNNRVDGNLAVSRAFGDGHYKNNTKAVDAQREQKVIAVPDVKEIELSVGDFAVLCCDGVFESRFNNEEVIAFVSSKMQQKPELPLEKIAAAVCEEALNRGSKDNITCMIVKFHDVPNAKETEAKSFIPGSYCCSQNAGFKSAYAASMAAANTTLEAALKVRFEDVKEKLQIRINDIVNPVERKEDEFECMTNVDLRNLYKSKVAAPAAQGEVPADENNRETWIKKCKFLSEAEYNRLVPIDFKDLLEEINFFEGGPKKEDDVDAWFTEFVANRVPTKRAFGTTPGGDGWPFPIEQTVSTPEVIQVLADIKTHLEQKNATEVFNSIISAFHHTAGDADLAKMVQIAQEFVKDCRAKLKPVVEESPVPIDVEEQQPKTEAAEEEELKKEAEEPKKDEKDVDMELKP